MDPRSGQPGGDPRRQRHLRRARLLSDDLTSAAIPPIGPGDHLWGEGERGLVVYADLGCPRCAGAWQRLREEPGRLVFRHFPLASKHPRSPALHAAAEAAGRQGRFFEMVDSLYGDRGRVDDPHLWERVERLGLDLERFESDRRSEEVAARVQGDFRAGIRAGITSTPGVFPAPGGGSVSLPPEREREF